MLAALGHSVVGVEPDPAAAAVARRAGHHVYDGTAESLPPELSAESFDVVIFMHVLEHCIDPFGAIRNAVGVLRNDGLVVAEVPNNGCEGARRFGVMWHWLDTPRHLNFFTAQSLADLFRSAGLGVQDVSFRGFCRQFSSSWKNAQGEIATRLGANADKRPGELDY
jgi:SAM-dependent methyltransferase